MPLETAASGINLGVVRNNARGVGFNAPTLFKRPSQCYRYSSMAPSSTDFDFAPLKAFTSSPST
jgi:hypothetical protein